MHRVLLTAVVLTWLLPSAQGSDSPVRFQVQPMAAPKPALRYVLLPEVRELHPGNPAQWYVRCFAEQRNFFFSKEGVTERERYRALPLAQLRSQHLDDYGGNALRQADWAARLDALDWQVGQRLRTDGLDVQLPEVQPLRILGMALQARFRARIAAGHFDSAIDNAKTMFGLARHLGQYPALAGNQIGLSIANQAVDSLDEMVQQPGCPNLYWALTDLPRHVVELRQGVQGDRTQADVELARIHDDAPMSAEELEQVVSRLSGRMGFAREQAGLPPRSVRAGLEARVHNADQVRAACRRLASAECTDDASAPQAAYQFLELSMKYNKFPPMQVILLDEKRAYQARRDQTMKLLGLEAWQIDNMLAREKRSADKGLFDGFGPDLLQMKWAQARLEQRLALLRHVEALRLYAAGHHGKLPRQLADMELPLPSDPFTGKPFRYHLDGATAYLDGGSPRGDGNQPTYNIHYEITIR
ncbi:MAG TPA: hypothetical protein VFA18_14450 [Gemmataceae bacterium]|nr:hypothetical protein [Gemmataceae bacterium]